MSTEICKAVSVRRESLLWGQSL